MAGNLSDELRAAGVVDTHYHVGPELLPRRYDVAGLAEAASGWDATLVLKNHTYCTTPLAALARKRFGARFFGGVVLNWFVGGLNPDAVLSAVSGNRAKVDDTAPDPSPIVVWMPTVHAHAHLKEFGYDFDPRWSGCCSGQAHNMPKNPTGELQKPVIAFDEDPRPTAALIAVLDAIAKYNCRLATGHLCAAEILRLIPLALEMRVPRIIVTHPHYPSVELSDSQLCELTKHPEVFIEHCFAIHTIEGIALETIAASVRATGPDQVILSTDFGQVHSDPFPDGTLRYASKLEAVFGPHVGRAQLVQMFSESGRRALQISAE